MSFRTDLSKVFGLTTNYRTLEGSHRCRKLRQRRLAPGIIHGYGKKILCQTEVGSLASLRKIRGSSFESTLIDLTVQNELDPSSDKVQTFRVLPRDFEYGPTDWDYPTACNFLIYDEKKGVKINELPVLVHGTFFY